MTTHSEYSDSASRGEASLREVQVAFLAALEQGEPPTVWLHRYPQHAAQLIDLAQARASEARSRPSPAAVAAIAVLARRTHAAVAPGPVLSLNERAKGAGLTLRTLAARVGLSSDILVKIDRRVVRPETVPGSLLRELAAALGCSAAALRAGLAGGGPVTAGALYHARQAPQVGQQTFAEAVAASVTLAPEARARWLQASAEPNDLD